MRSISSADIATKIFPYPSLQIYPVAYRILRNETIFSCKESGFIYKYQEVTCKKMTDVSASQKYCFLMTVIQL